MMAKGKNKKEEPKINDDFWFPLIITYVLTILVIVATCVLIYNIKITDSLLFYKIRCRNYFILSLAKIAETLVPTTMTFSLTLLLAGKVHSGKRIIIKIVIFLSILIMLGLILPTIESVVEFWIFLILIYLVVCCLVSSLHNFMTNGFETLNKSKCESSDGKFSK